MILWPYSPYRNVGMKICTTCNASYGLISYLSMDYLYMDNIWHLRTCMVLLMRTLKQPSPLCRTILFSHSSIHIVCMGKLANALIQTNQRVKYWLMTSPFFHAKLFPCTLVNKYSTIYSRTSIIRISIIRTLSYPNAILNFKIPKDALIFCKTK